MLGLLLVLFRTTFVQIFNIPADLNEWFLLIVLYFGFQSITSLLFIVFLADFETKLPTIIKVSARALELIGLFYLVEHGFGLNAILILICVTAGLTACAFVFLSRNNFQIKRAGELFSENARSIFKPFLTFGGLIWLNGLLEFILSKQTDIFLLNYYFGDPAIIGRYDVATNFGQLINFGLTTGMYGVSIASFSSLSQSKPSLLPDYWQFLNRTILLVLVPAFIACLWLADSLIPFVYSNTYYSSIILFQVFVVFLLTTRMLGGGIAADYIQSIARPSILLLSSAISGAVNLVLAIILIPKFGALGAILATGMGLLSIAAVHGYFICRSLNVSFQFSFAIRLIVMSLFVVWLLAKFLGILGVAHPIISLALFGAFFWLLLTFIKPLRNEDLKFFGSLPPQIMRLIQMITSNPSAYAALTDRQKWAFAWMPHSETTVDIGSSASPMLNLLRQKSKNVIAIDIDKTALAEVSGANPGIKVIESSSAEIPLESESCDTTLLLDVLEHVDDEAGTIAEIYRILKPNGTLIISVPHKGLFRFLDPQNLKATLTGKYSIQNEHRHYSEDDILNLLGLRFTVVRKHFGGLFLYPMTFAGNNFFQKRLGWNLGTFFKKLGDWDNDISWGALSYNLIILARKT